MKSAMKAGDKDRLQVIRMLRTELKYAQIDAGHELSEAEEQKVLASYAKKRKESIDQYREGGREELAAKEEVEYNITMEYLPAQLDEAELADIIKAKIAETGAESPKDFGKVMKAVMDTVGSRADGKAVSGLLKQMLN